MNLCIAGATRFFIVLNRFLGSFWTILIVVFGCALNVTTRDFLADTSLHEWVLAAYALPPVFLLSAFIGIRY
jgi:hypothetical protein